MASVLNISVELLKSDLPYYIMLYSKDYFFRDIFTGLTALLPIWVCYFLFYYCSGYDRDLRGKALAWFVLRRGLPFFVIGNGSLILIKIFSFNNYPIDFANNVIFNLIKSLN